MRILNIFLHQFQLQLIDLKKYSFTEISEQNLTVTAQKVNIKTNYMINDATTLASSSLTNDIFC